METRSHAKHHANKIIAQTLSYDADSFSENKDAKERRVREMPKLYVLSGVACAIVCLLCVYASWRSELMTT